MGRAHSSEWHRTRMSGSFARAFSSVPGAYARHPWAPGGGAAPAGQGAERAPAPQAPLRGGGSPALSCLFLSSASHLATGPRPGATRKEERGEQGRCPPTCLPNALCVRVPAGALVTVQPWATQLDHRVHSGGEGGGRDGRQGCTGYEKEGGWAIHKGWPGRTASRPHMTLPRATCLVSLHPHCAYPLTARSQL